MLRLSEAVGRGKPKPSQIRVDPKTGFPSVVDTAESKARLQKAGLVEEDASESDDGTETDSKCLFFALYNARLLLIVEV
jgi:hypothetical protein